MSNLNGYTRDFFRSIDGGAEASAHVVVPMLVSELGAPAAVVDVGCGSGAWLRVVADRTGARVRGVDGAHAVPHTSVEGLVERDLAEVGSLDWEAELVKPFDWTICLEVAEHLLPERGPSFVRELTLLADVVVFSAAVPGQPGTGHVNCRAPSYWRDLFAHQGYVGSGALRSRIWAHPEVEWWYQQNLMVFARSEASIPRLPIDGCPYLVHPTLYGWALEQAGVPA